MTKRKSKAKRKLPMKKRTSRKKKLGLDGAFGTVEEHFAGEIDPIRLLQERMDTLDGGLSGLTTKLDEVWRPGSDLRTTVAYEEGERSAVILDKIRKQLVGYLSVEQREAAGLCCVSPLYYALQWIDINHRRLFEHDKIQDNHPGVQIERGDGYGFS